MGDQANVQLTSSAIIEFRSVSKFFGTVKANDNISFQIKAGEICAIVGENGAGKSTLMKILFGLYQPDQGEILLRGQKQTLKNPRMARQQRIGMVHQHFILAGPITALDHVILDLDSKFHWSDLWKPLQREKILLDLESLSQRLRMPLDWLSPIEKLPVGMQQRLEILKLLYLKSEILIFDEPTAVLTPQETEEFLQRLRELKAEGKTIILITHKLKEVMAVADSIIVIRHGCVVASNPKTLWTIETIGNAMVGEQLKASQFQERPTEFLHQPRLKVENLLGKINFSVGKGEILGVAGVEGNGQNEILNALLHPKSLDDQQGRLGKCLLIEENKTQDILRLSNLDIRKSGVGYLAEDRHAKAVLLNSSLIENFALGIQDLFSKFGILNFEKLKKSLTKAISTFSIKIGQIDDPISSLSGGNQQKLVVARELFRPLNLLVAAQPTRGVDIGAIEKIHQSLWDLRKNGTAILLVSSELEELMKLSDRIIVMFRGSILGEFSREQFDEKKIGALMGGHKT